MQPRKWVWNSAFGSPEFNVFLFAFLIHFVYEVWQSPYFEFYGLPTFLDKVKAITHCTLGDGIITVICYWIVALLHRNRAWILHWSWQTTLLFTGLGWGYTFVSEIYRVQIARLYGIPMLAVPGLGISGLPLLQWVILPPIVLYLARRQLLGYRGG